MVGSAAGNTAVRARVCRGEEISLHMVEGCILIEEKTSKKENDKRVRKRGVRRILH